MAMLNYKQSLNTFTKHLLILIGIFSITACGGGKALDINNVSEINTFMQGKWTCDMNPSHGLLWRVEIVGNTLKLYERLETASWPSSPTAERNFNLGSPTRDIDNAYNIRYLDFDQGDLPLSIRSLGSIYVVCDEAWGEPAILYGSGYTGFHKGWH